MRNAAAASLKGWLHALIAAFQLLTRLPLPVSVPFTEIVLGRSVVFYPVVGALLGAVLAIAGGWLPEALPLLPAAVVLLGIWVYLTGALHLDGLMDTADGLFSHRSRERMLEIMKDSRVGAMGVIAGVLLLMMKLALLASLADGSWRAAAPYVLAIPVWSRSFLAVSIRFWPYARQDGGMGAMFRGVRGSHAAWALSLAALLTFGLLVWIRGDAGGGIGEAFGRSATAAASASAWAAGQLSVPLQAAVATGGLALLTLLLGVLLNRRIAAKLGGLTGDTYGAVNELLETGLLTALVVCVRVGVPLL